jgi:hypothetical protein
MLRKLRTWPSLEIRMQNKITIKRHKKTLKRWISSNMWEQPEQIKIQFRNKLKQTEV